MTDFDLNWMLGTIENVLNLFGVTLRCEIC